MNFQSKYRKEELMSYLVLARKYRPQTFTEVYAQDHITTILRNTIELDRIAQAYLFTGPRGVGKTSLARIFAKSLNCLENGPTIIPCNKCNNCQDITEGVSADVIEIDGASNTGVDDIRDLQKELMYSPTSSNFKIYIIDEVHMLSKSAFNALLKTLEEPPKNVIFIFATTEPHKVLPTIISRCQRFDFKRIPISAIVERLKMILGVEEVKIEEEALFLIAKKADGSMRDALSLMDQILAYGKDKILFEDVLSIFGIVHTEIFIKILQSIADRKPAEVIKLLHQVLEKGSDLQEFINGLLDFIRNLLLLKLDLKIPEITKSNERSFLDLSKKFMENELLYLVTLLIKTKGDIKTSNNPILIAEMTFIKLSKISEMIGIDKVIDSISSNSGEIIADDVPTMKRSERVLHNKTEKVKSNLKKEVIKEKPKFQILDADKFNDEFQLLLEKIKKENMFLFTYLKKCILDRVANNRIHFNVSSNNEFQRLKDSREIISKIFSQHFNLDIFVDFTLTEVKKEKVKINPTVDDIRNESPALADFIVKLGAEIKTVREKL